MTVYKIDLNYFKIEFLFPIMCIFVLLIIYKKVKPLLYDNLSYKSYPKRICPASYYSIVKVIFAFLISFFFIWMIFLIGENSYLVSCYKDANYSIIEGRVNNFKYIYANNSKKINGISFRIEEKEFFIHPGIFNFGYSYVDRTSFQDDDILKIYYIESNVSHEITKILQIDSIEKSYN